MPLPNKFVYYALFSFCSLLLGIALYFELILGLEPCPLCMAQRVSLTLIGLFSLIAAIHNPDKIGQRTYGVFIFLSSVLGVFLASRQVWLQNLPEDLVPSCGPGIYYMLDALPMSDVLNTMLMGSGDCAKVLWQDPILNLSIPSWTLIWFIVISALSVLLIMRSKAKVE